MRKKLLVAVLSLLILSYGVSISIMQSYDRDNQQRLKGEVVTDAYFVDKEYIGISPTLFTNTNKERRTNACFILYNTLISYKFDISTSQYIVVKNNLNNGTIKEKRLSDGTYPIKLLTTDNSIIILSTNNTVEAFSVSTLKLLWRTEMTKKLFLSPNDSNFYVKEDRLYIADSHKFVAVNIDNGKIQYTEIVNENIEDITTAGVVVNGDNIVISSLYGLYCFDLKSNELLWSKNGYFGKRPIIVDNNIIVGNNNSIIKVSLVDGSIIWSSLPCSDIDFSDMNISYNPNNKLVTGISSFGSLYVVSIETRKCIPILKDITCLDFLCFRNTLLVSTTEGVLRCDYEDSYEIIVPLAPGHIDRTEYSTRVNDYYRLQADTDYLLIHDIESTRIFGYNELFLRMCIGHYSMYVNGIFKNTDVPPMIINNRTHIPARYVTEPLGGQVSWDASEKKVTCALGETIVELWIGKSTAKVNGVEVRIDPNNPDVVPTIIDDRTMVPMRFLAESFGCEVEWVAETKEIILTYSP